MDVSNRTISSDAINTEWQQIQKAQSNPAYFRPLYERYYHQIFRFVYKRCLEEDVAADICSQVFLKALQKLGSYKFKGVPFSAWLYRIASNEVAQYFRDTAKHRTISVEDSNIKEMVDEIDIKSLEPYREAMILALNNLPLKDMQLIEMRFFEKRPFKEVANILGITESNAKVKTYRLLNKMKKIILAKSSRK